MKSILAISIVLFSINATAQDSLFFRRGDVLAVKIIQITNKEITYIKHSNLDGPTYVVFSREISKIVFQNGETETINASGVSRMDNRPNEVVPNFKRNIVGFNYFDLLFGRISVGYSRIFGKKGFWGAEVALSGGLAASQESSRPQNTYWALELSGQIYPLQQRRLTYFISPTFVIGEAHEHVGTETPPGWYYPGYPVYRYAPRYYVAGYLGQGLRVSATPSFSITFLLGLGARYNDADHSVNSSAMFKASVNYSF